MPTFAVIIPCFNEAHRLQTALFSAFLQENKEFTFFFVDDGSSDNTYNILNKIHAENVHQTHILRCTSNNGKGEAVRLGIQQAIRTNKFHYIGYIDADLSTSLEEFCIICKHAILNDANFIFGSRIKKLGSNISRSGIRHFIGRILITIIDKKFKLGFYDTQCGAKLFKSNILDPVVKEAFNTRWFFDIEIFLRLRKERTLQSGIEYPLKSWIDKKGSKINFLSLPLIAKEIITLIAKY